MATELYTVPSNENGFDSSKVDEHSELKIYLSQIRNVMNASNGTVCGAQEYGVDLEKYVYEMNLDEQQLQELISLQIISFCTYYKKFKTDIKVKFGAGVARDVCFIDFTINQKRLFQYRIY